jgi:hypothetical protein
LSKDRSQILRVTKAKIVELREVQKEVQAQIQQRDKEITELKTFPPKSASKEDRCAAREAQEVFLERSKTLETRITKIYNHYDAVQSKNTVLIGKFTMMAQIGGFGGLNTLIAKSLKRSMHLCSPI